MPHKENASGSFGTPFAILIIFIIFEYGRPQSFFSGLGQLYPGWILQLSLFIALLTTNKLFNFKDPTTKFFLALIILMFFHVPMASNNHFAYLVWRSMLLHFIIYMSILGFVDSSPKMERFINSWIIVNLICAVVGIKNGGRVPNAGFMGDENDFSLVMNMAIPFAYFMFLESRNKRNKLFYICCVAVFLIANIASLSRGGFIGLIPVAVYCWFRSPKKIIPMVLMVAMICIIFFAASPKYWTEVESIKEEVSDVERGGTGTGTGSIRWYYWKVATRIFLDNPIIGVGQGNYPWVMGRYEPPEGFLRRSHSGRSAHSLYFALLSELGIVGIICFVGMFYISRKGIKNILIAEKNISTRGENEEDKAVAEKLHKLKFIIFGTTGAMVGYLVSGAFLSVLYYPHFWFLTAIYVASCSVGNNLINKNNLGQNI